MTAALVCTLLPILGAVAAVAWTLRAADGPAARARAAIAATLMLASSVVAALLSGLEPPAAGPVGLGFDPTLGPAFGLDGLSAPLFACVAGLTLAVALGTPSRFADRHDLAGNLATGALFLGLVAARAPLLVAGLWVLSSVPTIAALRRRSRGRVFVAHRVASTGLVTAGLVIGGHWGADAAFGIAGPLVVLGVLIREGVFPFHAWVPRLFERAPLGTAMLFMQPQVGAYVLARFVIAGPLGDASLLLDVLGVISVLHGAMLALVQRSARRALGYLAVSQSALVLVGLADGGILGATGALLVILAVGLAQTGFGLALWAVEARRGPIRLDVDGGGFARTPALAGSLLVLGLASVGLPGTLSFVAEDLVFHATLAQRPWVGLAMVVATAINGINVVRIALRVFGGRGVDRGERDLTLRERLTLGLLGACLVGFGLFPQPLLTPAMRALERAGVPAVVGTH